MDKNTSSLILKFFKLGLTQEEILIHLRKQNIVLSRSSLQRHLKKRKLYRKKKFSKINHVLNFIEQKLKTTSAGLVGYKWMHKLCLQNRLNVTQQTVRECLHILDPAGIAFRRSKKIVRRLYKSNGPGYLFHLDGYDKIKPYGLAISGCIDGFSRKVIWLKVGMTNNDPAVISGYFVNAIEKLQAFPLSVRVDKGTENVGVIKIQSLLREKYSHSSRDAFFVGSSNHNQRIECFWSMLRKQMAEFYIGFFAAMKDDGLFSGDNVDKSLVRFCFSDIVQEELDNVVTVWNSHNIRKSNMALLPGGKPINLFQTPEKYSKDAKNCMVRLSKSAIKDMKLNCQYKSLSLPCEASFYNLCCLIMKEKGLAKEKDAHSAKVLYMHLRKEVRNVLCTSSRIDD